MSGEDSAGKSLAPEDSKPNPSNVDQSHIPEASTTKETEPAPSPLSQSQKEKRALHSSRPDFLSPVRTNTEPRPSVSVSVSLAQQPTKKADPPVKLVKGKDGQWALARDGRLVNNLSWVVGFMELANAGDFAANVWNQIPVPVYAVVFMAIGATLAGFLSIFAFRDSRRSYDNVKYLSRQRKQLREEKHRLEAASESTLENSVVSHINFRELGTEIVGRWFMDLIMGFGAVLICIGTFMAIGGANHNVYLASNLLSGYIGNAPIALFGLINSSWSVYIFSVSQGHVNASSKMLGKSNAAVLVKRRARKVQVYSVINGTATLCGGAGSLITATRWWGYCILVPVIIAAFFCNMWWRKQMGYTRSDGHPAIAQDELIYALEFAAAAEQDSSSKDAEKGPKWCSELPSSLRDTLELFERHSLFHQFCEEVMNNPETRQALCRGTDDAADMSFTMEDVLALPNEMHSALMEMAKRVAIEKGPVHFKNRQRYLAELLGTYCAKVSRSTNTNVDDSQDAVRGRNGDMEKS